MSACSRCYESPAPVARGYENLCEYCAEKEDRDNAINFHTVMSYFNFEEEIVTDKPTVQGLDLGAIEARANAATPGPWQQFDDGGAFTIEGQDGFSHAYGKDYSAAIWGPKGPGHGTVAAAAPYTPTKQNVADSKFIAHARTDIPALISALRESNDALAAQSLRAEKAEARVAELEKALEPFVRTADGLLVHKILAKNEIVLITICAGTDALLDSTEYMRSTDFANARAALTEAKE